MRLKLKNEEKVIKEGPANHVKGIEVVGGKLYLTNNRIIFLSHDMNYQSHLLSVPYTEIVHVDTRNTMLIIPNGFYIQKRDNSIEKFVTYGREEWIRVIRRRIDDN